MIWGAKMANKVFVFTVITLVSLACLKTNLSAQEEIRGRAIVLSGDSFTLINEEDKSEIMIRLWGIDAPELNQHCETETGRSVDCGVLAKTGLKSIIRRKNLTCIDFDKDQDEKITATCYIGDKILNSMVVRSGWALAFKKESSDYVGVEKTARLKEKGVWQYKFDKPWLWRKFQKKAQ